MCDMLIFFMTAAGLFAVSRFDRENASLQEMLSWKAWAVIAGACIINSAVLLSINPEYSYLSLCVTAASLMLACVTDCKTYQVYNFVWWISGAAGIIGLLSCGEGGPVSSLVFYVLLQQLFFARLYGRADCHAFCVCALIECGMGSSLTGYLLHMLFAFGLLTAVQIVRRNIGRDGNLKKPVAFLPYITLSFWLLLFLYRSGSWIGF